MEKILLGDGEFTAEIWSLGAAVNDLRMPDRSGQIGSVVLGYPDEAARRAGSAYLGEICGPFGNRIAAGGFVIDGQTYTPDLNESTTATLHGGPHGWSYADWEVVEAGGNRARLHLDWEDPKSGGFPGPIHADVVYELEGWTLTHTITATTETPTVLNIISHPYFNLSLTGEAIDDHYLQVCANGYLAVDEALIPLAGAPQGVEGTPFDFRVARRLGDALATPYPQIQAHKGLDHAFVLDEALAEMGLPAAVLMHPPSGRSLAIMTDYPALQVYTGQYLAEPGIHPVGAGGARSGIALETQGFPNAPCRPDFPNSVVDPGEVYVRTTTWAFQVI
ncbi:MAG: galactose mutarotase [Propionibacteriaceae bacterium]|nr:galactose mutarotase [Propionibacteriaceae bacterium]